MQVGTGLFEVQGVAGLFEAQQDVLRVQNIEVVVHMILEEGFENGLYNAAVQSYVWVGGQHCSLS